MVWLKHIHGPRYFPVGRQLPIAEEISSATEESDSDSARSSSASAASGEPTAPSARAACPRTNDDESGSASTSLGTGCPKCKALTANAEKAISELGTGAAIQKMEKIKDIARMGVAMTPALAVDGDVKSSGHLLSVERVKKLLTGEGAAGS